MMEGMASSNTSTADGAATACAPLHVDAIDADDAHGLALVFAALGDPTRLRLLSLIASHPDGEACVCELTEPVGLTQPTVSHHLKRLVDAGLLTREQRGRWAYYTVVDPALAGLRDALDSI